MTRAYLNYVAQLPCNICQGPGDNAHHIKHIGHFSGAGLKAPDILSMSLCMARGCHQKLHNTPELWPRQYEWVLKTIAHAVRDGVIKA